MATMRGQCLCGTVRYEIEGEPMVAVWCHCSRCRKATGAAAEPGMMIQTDQLRVVEGRANIATYRSTAPEAPAGAGEHPAPGTPYANRSFCTTCGSTLFVYHWPDGPLTVVPMGSLEGDAGVRPSMHIHVTSKAPWHEITDDLPQMPGMPGM